MQPQSDVTSAAAQRVFEMTTEPPAVKSEMPERGASAVRDNSERILGLRVSRASLGDQPDQRRFELCAGEGGEGEGDDTCNLFLRV